MNPNSILSKQEQRRIESLHQENPSFRAEFHNLIETFLNEQERFLYEIKQWEEQRDGEEYLTYCFIERSM